MHRDGGRLMNREERRTLERRLTEYGRNTPHITEEQRLRLIQLWRENADKHPQFAPLPLQPSSAFVHRRVNRWTPVQVGIYILVPVLALVAYALGLAWAWGRWS